MSNIVVEDKYKKTLDQIEMIDPNLEWIMDDLRRMKIRFKSGGVDVEEILLNKDSLIKEVWKIGKAQELSNRGLLNFDGSLTKEAFDYLDQQKKGGQPSGIELGDIAIEFSVHKAK